MVQLHNYTEKNNGDYLNADEWNNIVQDVNAIATKQGNIENCLLTKNVLYTSDLQYLRVLYNRLTWHENPIRITPDKPYLYLAQVDKDGNGNVTNIRKITLHYTLPEEESMYITEDPSEVWGFGVKQFGASDVLLDLERPISKQEILDILNDSAEYIKWAKLNHEGPWLEETQETPPQA